MIRPIPGFPIRHAGKRLLLALAALGGGLTVFSPLDAPSAVVTLQEGAAIGGLGTSQAYRGAEDVMLIQWASTSNFGGRADFDVGQLGTNKAHSLLRFDLAPLKYRMESINSITLQLTAKGLYVPDNPGGVVEVYRVADANADWVEGTYPSAQSPPPVDGFSTWSHRRRRVR